MTAGAGSAPATPATSTTTAISSTLTASGHAERWPAASVFAPIHRGRLKFSPYVRDVMAVGGENRGLRHGAGHHRLRERVGPWAENSASPTTFVDLSQRPGL